jgi:serine/threonine protein kinase
VFNHSVNDDVSVIEGVLTIKGHPVDRLTIESVLGDDGANGIVFGGKQNYIEQPRAIKVWLNLREGDTRDKVTQGIQEAKKIAGSNVEWVAQVYDAEVVEGVFYTSMELIPGTSSKKHLTTELSKWERWWLARLYINGIEKTTTEKIAHGDAHPGNVIVYEHVENKYEGGTRLKFIDFGTSLYSGVESSRERHWCVVDATFQKILKPFGQLAEARRDHGPVKNREEYLKIPYYDDVLSHLKAEAGIIGF